MNAIDGFVEQVKKHTHAPFAKGCELIKVRASNKRKASTTHDTTQQILGTKLVYLTPTAAVNLPNLRNLRRNNRRQWQEQNILPNAPREEDVPVLPHKYQMAGGGERFLFFDNGLGDSNKTFIFATKMELTSLSVVWWWYLQTSLSDIFSNIYNSCTGQ